MDTQNSDELRTALREYIAKEFLDGQATSLEDDTPLLQWSILTSMNIARLLVFVRDELGVEIPPQQIVGRNFKDLNAITDMVAGVAASQ